MKKFMYFNTNKDQDKVKVLYKFSQMEKFDTKNGIIAGIAVPYNEQTQDYRKMAFAPKSFKNLKKVSAFVNHDSWDVMSMVGVSEFKDTKGALKFKMTLNMKDPDILNKIIPLIEMGALEGVSIGAYIYKREIEEDEDGDITQITITESEIYELSLVTFQAFENAKIEANKENAMGKKNNKPVEQKETITLQEEEVVVEETQDEESTEVEEVEEPTEEEAVEESEETEEEAEPVEETEEEETEPVEEVEEEEASIQTLSVEQRLEAALKENEELKNNSNEKEKKDAVKDLVSKGIIYKAQSDRIMKQFNSAESILEFYKDLPASYSVEPKGEGQVDITSEEIKSELHSQLASETSLSKEDYDKYNKKGVKK